MEYFRLQGAKGGKLSAKARMDKLTPEQRSEIGKNAVAARWAKKEATPAETKSNRTKPAASKKEK